MTSSACQKNHTKVQVPISDFRCPKCGNTPESTAPFYIEQSEDPDCDQLHPGDYLVCEGCGYGAGGKQFIAAFLKKALLVTCSHCGGSGVVPAPPVLAKKAKQ